MSYITKNAKYVALSTIEIGNGALLVGALFAACRCAVTHSFSDIENSLYTGMAAGGLITAYFRATRN